MAQVSVISLEWWRQEVVRLLRSPIFYLGIAASVVALVLMLCLGVDLQWYWIMLYFALFIPFLRFVIDPVTFFRGGLTESAKTGNSLFLLASSTFIAWVFAKSILNASTLGAKYGLMGGFAYAAWYTSIPSAAIVGFLLRTRRGYSSLMEAVATHYGVLAAATFTGALLFRLYQEVWSNAIVVASFFGPEHSFDWWLAACLSTAIPALYVLIGGLRASLTSDMVQAVGAVAFLIAMLAILGANNLASFASWNPAGTCSNGPDLFNATSQICLQAGGVTFNATGQPQDLVRSASIYMPATCNYPTVVNQSVCVSSPVGGTWYAANCTFTREPQCSSSGGDWSGRTVVSLEGGLDLLFTGLLQGILSYAFFDPVLTDRAFLAAPHTMLLALMLAAVVAATFIILFSFLGIFGNMQATLDPQSVSTDIFAGMLKGNPASVSKFFGTGVYSIVNIIFITSSISTLDSTFSSASKLVGLEVAGILRNGQPIPAHEATRRHLIFARLTTLVLPVLGLLVLMANAAALDATTVSGTIVMGLGPPIWATTFVRGYRPLLFHLPFWFGVALGLTYQLSTSACCKDTIDLSGFAIGSGHYAILFGVNLIGAAVAWGLAGLVLFENLGGRQLGAPSEEPPSRLLRVFLRCFPCFGNERETEAERKVKDGAVDMVEDGTVDMVKDGTVDMVAAEEGKVKDDAAHVGAAAHADDNKLP